VSASFRRDLAEVAYRLAKPGKFAAIYTGTGGIDDFSVAFKEAGWVYRWMVSCERQSSNVYSRIFRRWVPIGIYQKPPGKFLISGFLTDRISGGKVEKEIHHWAQPANESRLMIEAFTSAGELVVDLTCGSCSSAIGMLGAAGGTRRYFGCDTDAKMIKAARSRIDAALKKQG
jgi:SAM-dependent methyltransferase